MGSEGPLLHIFFFPFASQGHLLPMMDTAKLFAAHGVKASLILTPLGASIHGKAINRAQASGYSMDLLLIQYPPEADLPGGDENPDKINCPESKGKFFRALRTLEKPFQKLVEEHRPDVVVSDIFFPWTVDVATKFGIPRLSFNGSSIFSLCVFDTLRRYSPHLKVEREDEPFVLPGLPDHIELTRAQIPAALKTQTNVSDLWANIREGEAKSYGVVMNSFYELEQNYVEHVRKKIGRKAWHVGPVSLCNRDTSEIAERGTKAPIDAPDCLNWLDTQKSDSVLYICFGSLCKFSPAQHRETAMALESSDCSFIWVLKDEEKVPEGFEERMKGKGFIIRGWARQIQILNHPAVGGFVTHCGWNSILEGVTAGLPMITWPVFAEQFFNEKLITKALKIGVGVGAGLCSSLDDANNKPMIKREVIEEAVRSVMSDTEEAKRMRAKAREYGAMGKRAVEEGGSSYTDLHRLIDELKMMSFQTRFR
ncbi:probable UDP-glucosyl transferase 73B6 [Aristolochia californica]|uniref:probable UDP-glucosyl transferase 73B6 n=1 Tax=Aristolochia californica TaxID=171875 RepID=UPI0035E158C0